MPNSQDPNELAELSRHYDSMLWTVTSLWAAAVGGLLVYSVDRFDPWLGAFGLFLTLCAMFFAFSFRRLRRRVHQAMPENIRRLVVQGSGLRQWDVLSAVFVLLVGFWARLFVQKSGGFCAPWSLLWLVAGVIVIVMWKSERWPGRPDA